MHARVRTVARLAGVLLISAGVSTGACAQSGPSGGAIAESPEPWKHTNRLVNTTSPYLLQHAHNPVDWYPWGPEALERAKKEDKPIFLSVGYSTCYWCHVMEREVFENEAIADLMNERFVCVKVDREERPDLDEIYMTATQLMTQHGGWPNSVFLTPDLKPFFAGTYFGPTDRGGRPGFGTVVTQLGDAWTAQRETINDVSGRVADAIRSVLGERLASIPKATLDAALVDKTVEQIAASYDPRDGGFGLAPKFPSDFYYSFLLDVHARRAAGGDKDAATLAMVTKTLDAMAAGGIHDHVGGGFHRYSTDGQWKVPHFEKMLYNQAHLAVAYIDAFAATGDAHHADTARGVFRFVGEVFTGPQGQFYSALDAETDAVEGAYYTWTREQIEGVLGDKDAAKFLGEFELADVPIFPGHKHPEGGTLVRKVRGAANTPEINAMLGKLAAVRKTRKLPRLDDKAIAAWNGMMIDAYARGAEVLKDDAYRAAAAHAATFVLEHMRTPDGRLLRSVRIAAGAKQANVAAQEGFLEDYAFVIRGLLALHRVEADAAAKAKWLDAARSFAAKADELFWDEEGGGYFFATPQPDLIARGKDIGDNATPGGNSVMAHNLIELAAATGDGAYRAKAEALLTAFSGSMAQALRGSVHMVHALEQMLSHAESAAPHPHAATGAPAAEVPPASVEAVFARLRSHEFSPLDRSRFTIDRALRKQGIADLDDVDWSVRLLALRDLVGLGKPHAAEISKGLSDGNLQVRYLSATALGILKAADTTAALERALVDDADALVRSQAAFALGQIESEASVPLLRERMASDPSRDVQHQCELSIDQIGKHMGSTDELRSAYASLDPARFESVRVGEPAPDFTLPDTEDARWSLASHKGRWVALIWIFADWCPVCHGEFHELIELREAFEKAGVDVATIEAHDRYRARVMVGKEVDPRYWFSNESYKEEYTQKIWWPHLLDRAGAIGAIYGVDPLAFSVHAEYINRPATILIDPEGVVRFAYYGTFWGDRPSIRQTLDMILSETFEFSSPRRLITRTGDAPVVTPGVPNPPPPAPVTDITRATDSRAHVSPSASVDPASASPGEIVTVTVTLRIDEGWHINANPASADFLVATSVDVRTAAKPGVADAATLEVVGINYPMPMTLKAEGLGSETINIYSGTARVAVTVRVPRDAKPGTTIPLRVLAKFQSCSDAGVCLMPAEWTGEVIVSVNAAP